MTNFGMPGSELIAHQIGEWADKLIDRQIERTAWLGCNYCADEPEPGWIEMPDNGPIVRCPVCEHSEQQKAGGQPNKRAGHNQ